ncbi:MAG: ribonuclease HI [Proteobacteria bacterium]|nr:ribonuclease HI [Pseudomonadota bacterium]
MYIGYQDVSDIEDRVVIYTDGGCSPNPGCGGWAALLQWRQHEKLLMGSVSHSTNNRMELWAVIEGLKSLKYPAKVEVYSDSQYIVRAFNDGWIENWRKKGWKLKSNQPVKNQDLWATLYDLVTTYKPSFHWVKGHSGVGGNERVDQALNEARDDKINHQKDLVYEKAYL